MDDTPQHIKDMQREIWLTKPPIERLEQFLIDKETLFLFWNTAKKNNSHNTAAEAPAE